jgi:hypothetical protein
MQTARMIEAEWRQVLQGSMSMGAKEDKSSTGHIWAAGFHHVTAHPHLVHVLILMNHLFLKIFKFLGSHSKPRITETADIGLVDRGARL